jgi:hypothetical protein
MKKHSSPSKLRIRRETLASLASPSMKRAAGATWHDYCTEVCTYVMACQSITCPSVDAECFGTMEPSCRC